MPKLIVFDVDGVLLTTEVGGFKLLAEALGKGEEMRKQHAEYEKRKHSGPWGLEQLAQLFSDIPEKEVEKHARKIIDTTLRLEAFTVIDELRKKGYFVVAYSSNPSWIMNCLKEKLQLDDVCANVLEVIDGKITGRLQHKIDRYGKEKRLVEFMEKYHLSKKDVVIVGDSVSDLPMAQHGTFYSFNTHDPTVIAAAKEVMQPPLTNVLNKILV